jgi:hypothetical protein
MPQLTPPQSPLSLYAAQQKQQNAADSLNKVSEYNLILTNLFPPHACTRNSNALPFGTEWDYYKSYPGASPR